MKKLLILLLAFVLFNLFLNDLHSQWENIGALNCGSNTCGISYSNGIYIGSVMGCVNISNDYGKSYNDIRNGIEDNIGEILSFATFNNNLFLIQEAHGIFILKENSSVWKKLIKFPKYTSVSSIIAVGKNLAIGIYKSENKSGVYLVKEEDKSLKLISNIDWKIKSLCAIEQIIFASVEDKGIFYTTDYGENWFECNNGISSKKVNSLKQIDGYLLANTANGFDILDKDFSNWRSTKIWQDNHVECFTTYKGNIIIDLNNAGIFVSSDYGYSWSEKNEGLINKNSFINIFSLDFNDIFVHKDYLFGLNVKNSIWRRKLSELISLKAEMYNDKSDSTKDIDLQNELKTNENNYSVNNPKPLNMYDVGKEMIYPEKAVKNQIEGKVEIDVFVDENGNILKLGKISGPDVFFSEIYKIIWNLRFSPAIKDGIAVQCWVTVPFYFKIQKTK